MIAVYSSKEKKTKKCICCLVQAALYECLHYYDINIIIEDIETPLLRIQEDLEAFSQKDPSSSKNLEILAKTSTSFSAVLHYRLANWIYTGSFEISSQLLESYAFLLSQRGKLKCGAEIHFKCNIGRRFILDHGWGIVFGETVAIGHDCYILGGVVLGATGISNNQSIKRHPTIGNNVQIGSFSQVLGNISIGNNVFIGTHCIVTENVPSNTRIINKKFFPCTK